MEPKNKDTPKTKDVLRQLQTEMQQLQSAVNRLHGSNQAQEFVPEKATKTDWIVQYAVRQNQSGGAKPETQIFTESHLARITDESAATLGSAISSAQKVGLLRALMAASSSGESAVVLGTVTGLSTGSLYHHLHDLMHAALIGQSARNRYTLTERGRRVLLVLLALAA